MTVCLVGRWWDGALSIYLVDCVTEYLVTSTKQHPCDTDKSTSSSSISDVDEILICLQ